MPKNFSELPVRGGVTVWFEWMDARWERGECYRNINILSLVGCVTRLISSLCQECSGYLLCYLYTLIHFTIQYLDCFSTICVAESIQLSLMAARLRVLSSAVNARLLSSITVIPRLLFSEVNARLTFECNPLLYMRPLLCNEPFVVAVETSVRITVEL
jgi:hypothetical protein